MQFTRNTSRSKTKISLMFFMKALLILVVITALIALLNKIDFPSPNKEIEKIIPNEKLRIIK